MKIDTLTITNFRGIQKAEIRKAGDTVIIAGQNGSGKSCVFDAIRLLKSVYGGYHQNEWQNWFGEFQVNPNSRAEELKGFFNDPGQAVSIDCFFTLRDDEKAFIHANAEALLEDSIWRMLLPEAFQWGGYQIDLPDFFEPIISGKMALQEKGRADEKESIHRRADRRHVA